MEECRALTPRPRNRSPPRSSRSSDEKKKHTKATKSVTSKTPSSNVFIEKEFCAPQNILYAPNKKLPLPQTPVSAVLPPSLFPRNGSMVNVCNMSSFVYMMPPYPQQLLTPHSSSTTPNQQQQQQEQHQPHHQPRQEQQQLQQQKFMSSMMLWPIMTPLKQIEPSTPLHTAHLPTPLHDDSINMLHRDHNKDTAKNSSAHAHKTTSQAPSPGVGRKCEHRFHDHVKPWKSVSSSINTTAYGAGVTSTLIAKCTDLCGSVIRRCPDCLLWTNHK